MTDQRYWIWLSLGFQQGSPICDSLIRNFHYNPKAIFDAEPEELRRLVGADSMKILNSARNFSRVNRIYEFCQKENIGLLTPDSKFYPSSLLRITGVPPVIYYKGRLPDFSSRPVIGIVGTRKVTPYGKSASYTISHDIASAGAIVVSGMALGTDAAAHRGALDAKGCTVAFLGCGIDVVYPRENESMMREIAENGAVMTDYAPGERPEGWHFPLRNRLISGASHGVLVVEAAMKSGALITADHAIKQGKLIYAVPGKVGELASTGTNNLIRQGAKMVTCSGDILSDFKGLFKNNFNADYRSVKSISYSDIPPKNTAVKKTTPNPVTAYVNTEHAKPITVKPVLSEPSVINSEQAAPIISNSPINPVTSPKPLSTVIATSPQHRNNFIYPSEPLTEEGYTPVFTVSDIEKYILPELKKAYSNGDVAKEALYNHVTALKALRSSKVINQPSKKEDKKEPSAKSDTELFAESYEKELKSIINPEKKPENTKALPNTEGLSEDEGKILLFIAEKGNVTVDGMASLGISVPKLLAYLTSLEINGLIDQLPGGYFKLK